MVKGFTGTLLFFILSFYSSLTQTISRATISGQVIDNSTGAPLQFVNVFIASTSLGSTTDEKGFYYIKRVPLGNHELIASMMGYELKKVKIRLTESIERKFDFRLKPKVLQAPEIKVTSNYPRQWNKNLKRFKKQFLGTSKNASKCKILNAEVLDFEYNKFSQNLTATASQPLQIENWALGYRIDFFLKDFKSYHSGEKITFMGMTKFEHLSPKSPEQEKMWGKNRLKTYNGSLKHFLTILISGNLIKEGFQVSNVATMRRINLFNVIIDNIISSGELPFESKLNFQNYLYVEYTPKQYASWIKLSFRPVIITTLGSYEPYSMWTYGYWSSMRVADLLPMDYEP